MQDLPPMHCSPKDTTDQNKKKQHEAVGSENAPNAQIILCAQVVAYQAFIGKAPKFGHIHHLDFPKIVR